MNTDELWVVGCVMGWEERSVSRECPAVPMNAPAVLEYCPAETVLRGMIKVTDRMMDLARAGYRPAALVSCDVQSATGTLFLSARDLISDRMRSQLALETGWIFSEARQSDSLATSKVNDAIGGRKQ